MIKKLRNQPYAAKWEQEERKKTDMRSTLCYSITHGDNDGTVSGYPCVRQQKPRSSILIAFSLHLHLW
jgi:hypothetical protein